MNDVSLEDEGQDIRLALALQGVSDLPWGLRLVTKWGKRGLCRVTKLYTLELLRLGFPLIELHNPLFSLVDSLRDQSRIICCRRQHSVAPSRYQFQCLLVAPD